MNQDTLFFSDVISDEDLDKNAKYTEYLPVYSVEAVATSFSKEQPVDLLGWKKVKAGKKLQKDMFIAKVVGKSMEPTIKDGSYCIFRFEKGGSRNGLVVLETYHAYKSFGYNPIQYKEIGKEQGNFTTNQATFLETCYGVFIKFSAHELVNMTHNELPWKIAFNRGNASEISHESMSKYYSNFLKKHNGKKEKKKV